MTATLDAAVEGSASGPGGQTGEPAPPPPPWGLTHAWYADDPKRPCFSCGAPSTRRFHDGSPNYDCGPHPIVRLDAAWQPQRLGQQVMVTLTPAQVKQARKAAEAFVARVLAKGAKDTQGYTDQGLERRIAMHAKGFRGEIALATYLGVPWKVQRRAGHHPDVLKCHVRTTTYEPPMLMFRNDEDPAALWGGPCVLVWDANPDMTLLGWGFAVDLWPHVTRRELVAGRGTVALVSANFLRPITELVTTHRKAAGLPPAA